MKHRRFKKTISILLTFAFVMGIFSMGVLEKEVDAHNQDWETGSNGYNNSNIRFNIQPSALNSFINLGMYTLVRTTDRGWNGISSKVEISDVNINLTGTNLVQVRGESTGLQNLPGGGTGFMLGNVKPLFALPPASANTWSSATVTINTNPQVWEINVPLTGRADRIRKTIIHEFGHVLKLLDPTCSSNAVMQQGYPSNAGGPANVSPTVSNHDRINLRAKWGN